MAFLKRLQKWRLVIRLALKFDKYAERAIFQPALGSFIVEVDITAVNHLLELSDVRVIAVTQDTPVIEWNDQAVTLCRSRASL